MSTMKKLIKTIFMVDIAQGMAVTIKTFFTRSVTRQYPTFKRKPIPGSRGLHAMRRDENGAAACIGCGLCEAVCPANAITVVTSEGPGHEKLVNAYELDLLRCVFCGFCIDACPVSAIVMTPDFELACYERKDAFYTKDRLVAIGDQYMGRKAAPVVEKKTVPELPSAGEVMPTLPAGAGEHFMGGKAVEKP